MWTLTLRTMTGKDYTIELGNASTCNQAWKIGKSMAKKRNSLLISCIKW